jgi:hypothetical protein
VNTKKLKDRSFSDVKVYRDPIAVPPPPAPEPACAECEFTRQWVHRVGLAWPCWKCGTHYEPVAPRPPALPPRDPFADLEALAEWLPEIEGRAIPMEAPLHYESKHASSTLGKEVNLGVVTGRPFDAANDDPADAGEAGSPDGLTMHVKSGQHTAGPGRKDHIDEHSHQFRRAVEALQILDRLVASGPEGRRAALVLIYTGLWLGPIARESWWTATESDLVYGADDNRASLERLERARADLRERFPEAEIPDAEPEDPLGLDWRLGVVFAAPDLRATWLRAGLMGYGFARMAGRQHLADAVMAYRRASQEPPQGAPRVDMATARHAISVGTREADRDLREAFRDNAVRRRSAAWQRLRKAETDATRNRPGTGRDGVIR